ncbi:MAG: prepilin peptidase [Clostridia bacterium]|nr:prepilin peptidase [Clostridia bacterium]
MYINDVNIIVYVIAAILGAVAGQFSDLLNFLLPKHKQLLSIKNIKEYIKNTRPKYLLMVIHILIYIGILYRYGINDVNTIKYMVLTPLIISAFYIDYKMQIIPNRLTLTIFEIGLIFTFIHGISNLNIAVSMFQGLLAGCLIFLVITVLGGLIFGKETMGFGDVKMMAALGLFFGLQGIIAIAILSFLIAAIFSIVLMIIQKIRHKDLIEYIAFGPFIVISAFVVIFVPLEILMILPFVIFSFGKYKL